MGLSKERLKALIDKLPESTLEDVEHYLEKKLQQKHPEFDRALDFTFSNYNETLKGLKDR